MHYNVPYLSENQNKSYSKQKKKEKKRPLELLQLFNYIFYRFTKFNLKYLNIQLPLPSRVARKHHSNLEYIILFKNYNSNVSLNVT